MKLQRCFRAIARFVAERDTWIGIVPVGYADGFRRDLTGTTVRVAGEPRRVAVEDVARYRDALGATPPPGIAAVHLEPVARPLESVSTW